ncbi:MAG: hypothetical protein EOM12_03685 [Verrucomicrobiae bacterium]|nr:hypothetical protein [Verrucomicrobiae bacterium]
MVEAALELEKKQNELTPENVRERKQSLVEYAAEKARRDYLTFCHYVDKGYQSPKHLRELCQKLMALEKGEIQNLMIFMPPRHGKSETVSRKLPAWWLGRNPDHNVIVASYAQSLTRGFSRHVRDLIESRLYRSVFPISTSHDSRAVNDWNVHGHRGGLLAAGVGGAVTGYGAHLFIIDDPIKNLEEAESVLMRDKVWEWYRSVVLTRMEPGGKKILIMTRWNQDDLAGRILKELKDEAGEEGEWEILDLCALVETNEQSKIDPLGRKIGDPLWEARYNTDKLMKVKKRVGSRIWSALFQQQPMDSESRKCLREWIRWYDEKDLPQDAELIKGAGCDTATSKENHADNMAFVEALRSEVNGVIYFDEVFCEKVSVRAFAKHVSARQAVRKFSSIRLESNNAGEAIKQRINEIGAEDGTYPPVVPVATSTDKMVRFLEWQHLIENGTIRFRRGKKRVAEFVEHLINFDGTGSDVDDDVDAAGFAIKAVTGGSGATVGVADLLDVRPGQR